MFEYKHVIFLCSFLIEIDDKSILTDGFQYDSVMILHTCSCLLFGATLNIRGSEAADARERCAENACMREWRGMQQDMGASVPGGRGPPPGWRTSGLAGGPRGSG